MRTLRDGTLVVTDVGSAIAPRAEVGRHPWRRLPDVLFGVLLVFACAPIWVVPHVPTQDGGSHVETVMALLRLRHTPLLQQHYVANYGLQPNWLTQVLFAALSSFAAPRIAEKLVLTGSVLLLPLAFRAAVPSTERARWASLAVFPFIYSFAFHMGFWNFTYSLALYLAVVGPWSLARGRLGTREAVAFGWLLLLTYFAHSVSTSSAVAAITVTLLWRTGVALLAARRDPARRSLIVRGYARRAGVTCLAALPVLALLARFLARQPRSTPVRLPLFDYAKHLATLYALLSFDVRELALTVPVALVLAWGVAATLRERRVRRVRVSDAWLAVAAVATVLYFCAPDAAIDGAQLTDRLALYPWLAILVWLAASAAPVRRVRAVAVVCALVFVAGTAYRISRYREIDRYLADYDGVAPHVAEGSTILPLTFEPGGPRQGGTARGERVLSRRIDVARHLAGYLATDRNGVNLGNSQANTSHAPLRWRPGMDPFTLLDTHRAGLEDEPPCVVLRRYTAAVGPIDAVVVWGVTPALARDPCGAAVLAELGESYERTFTSPHGTAQLFRPRSCSAAGPSACPHAQREMPSAR